MPLRFASARGVLELLSTVSVIVTAEDVTLSELSVVAYHPLDEATAALLRSDTPPAPG